MMAEIIAKLDKYFFRLIVPAIGDTLAMTVYRQGSTMELTVTVGEQVQSALANEQTQQAASDSQGGGWNGYPFGGRR